MWLVGDGRDDSTSCSGLFSVRVSHALQSGRSHANRECYFFS